MAKKKKMKKLKNTKKKEEKHGKVIDESSFNRSSNWRFIMISAHKSSLKVHKQKTRDTQAHTRSVTSHPQW